MQERLGGPRRALLRFAGREAGSAAATGSRLARFFVGAVLVATGVGKILDIPGFVDVLAAYRLLPAVGNVAVAYSLPFIELATGIGLLLKRPPVLPAVSATGLHGMLLVVSTATLLRGISIDNCGCFGVFLARPLTFETLIEDAVLLALSAWVWKRAAAGLRG